MKSTESAHTTMRPANELSASLPVFRASRKRRTSEGSECAGAPTLKPGVGCAIAEIRGAVSAGSVRGAGTGMGLGSVMRVYTASANARERM